MSYLDKDHDVMYDFFTVLDRLRIILGFTSKWNGLSVMDINEYTETVKRYDLK